MKTFKLIYDETVTYEKIIDAKNIEEAREALANEVADLSTWQIKDADSQYNEVMEVAQMFDRSDLKALIATAIIIILGYAVMHLLVFLDGYYKLSIY